MADPFLQLLGALISPNLSSSEVTRVRSLLSQSSGGSSVNETPWASGVPDLSAKPTRSTAATDLETRVRDLEITVVVLCEALARNNSFDAVAFAERSRQLREEISARKAEDAAWVTCSNCSARVPRAQSYRRVTGELCEACHLGRRASVSSTVVETVPGDGYRSAPREVVRQKTVACIACNKEVPLKEAFNSSAGPRCHPCHLQSEEAADSASDDLL